MTTRVGFLGGGLIATYHGLMLHTSDADAAIVSVHDPDPRRAVTFADAFADTTVAATEEELLDAVDAVYVCTWTSEHPRLVAAAAERGLAVFCEKPLAVDVAAAAAMVRKVEQVGVVNQVGLVLRDSPAFLLLRDLLADPDVGRVMSVVFRDDQYIPTQGMYASTWRADPTKAGSGTLLEHSIHDLDLLEWMFGPIASVSGRSAEFHEIRGIEDVMTTSVAFESGALGTLTSIWHDVLSRPSLRRVEVFCERAYFVLEGDVDGPVGWMLPDGDEGVLRGDALFAGLAERGIELRNPDAAFIAAIQAGESATPDFATALRAHVLADAVYRSAGENGLPVTLTD